MRALIIDDFRRKGGGQSYGRVMAEVLAEMGYEVHFLTNVDNIEWEAGKTAYTIKYEFNENSSKILDIWKIVNLRKQLKEIDISKYEISINNHPNVFIMKGKINVLHGFSFLDPWIDEKGEVLRYFPPKLIKKSKLYSEYNSALFVPNSQYTKEVAFKLFPLLDLDVRMGEVLHPPIDVKEWEINEKKDQVLIFGRIDPHKGIEDALRIANDGSYKVVIAGYVNRGEQYYLEKFRRKSGGNIEIRTNVTKSEKEELMNESSTILSLNKKEHFGMAIAEAMSHGCVPVVPKSGGQWSDIIEYGRYGIGYDNEESIKNSIQRSFDYHFERRVEIAKSVQRFSVSEFSKSFGELIKSISSSHK